MEPRTNEPSPVEMVQTYWTMAVRRKWLILGSVVLSLAVAGTLCKVLPKVYRSSTLISVERQKIPEGYVGDIVGGSLNERLTMIKQRLLSRTMLGKVVKEFKLYSKEGEQGNLEAAVNKMRLNIEIETVGRKVIQAFKVSFSHVDPVSAQKVTGRLASRFIEENLKIREQFVEGATQFLDFELGRAKTALEKKEHEISQYKSRHRGELPQDVNTNLRTLDRVQQDLQAGTEAIQSLSDRLVMSERVLRDYDATGTTSPGLVPGEDGRASPRERLRELERKLSSLSAEYKDTYPDVITIRQEIEVVKTQLGKKFGQEAETRKETPADPYLRELNKQRDELRRELAYHKARQSELLVQRNDYEKRVEEAPALEQEILILFRDYENMKANYQSVLGKRLNAQVAANLEMRNKSERFQIIDPANLPNIPEKPNQKKIMTLGLASGCAVGFGLALLIEMLNPAFRRPEDLEQLLGLNVLAAIPDFGFAYAQSTKQRGFGASKVAVPSDVHNVSRQAKSGANLGRPKWWRWRVPDKRTNRIPPGLSLVAKSRPTSVIAEQYRVAATQLSLMEAGRSTTVVLVTSAVKGEGKSTTLVNLGYTLARDLGKRTLLIDGDFKCPTVHWYLEVPPQPGLADVLAKGIPLERCLSRLGEIPFWVLPVGSRGKWSNSLAKVHEFASILTDLRARFEYILIDAPPILPLADIHILAGLADVLVLVVRAGSTPQDIVRRALNALRLATQPPVILNGVEASSMPYYMYYDYQAQSAEEQRV